jgi:hypothetical protein
MAINSISLPNDPFDGTKILIHTVIDKLEQNYLQMTSEHFTSQVEQIEKDIKLLTVCVTKMTESPEKTRRNNCVKKLEQRVNNMKTLFLTQNSRLNFKLNSESNSGQSPISKTSNDNQKLLISAMIEEQDKHLEMIGMSVNNLKQTADTIKNEIESSNKILDEINVKVEETDERMKFTTNRIRILNNKIKNNCFCKTAMIIGAILILFIVVLIFII